MVLLKPLVPLGVTIVLMLSFVLLIVVVVHVDNLIVHLKRKVPIDQLPSIIQVHAVLQIHSASSIQEPLQDSHACPQELSFFKLELNPLFISSFNWDEPRLFLIYKIPSMVFFASALSS